MAHNVEPMDIDNIESDFDNKENSIHHSNVYPRTPCTEKGYEELDVSELNMKLRYSITPATSPMSKSYTANYADSRGLELGDDTLNANLTRSLHSAFSKSDVMNKSVKMLPLQTISSDQFVDSNRNTSVLRPLDTTTILDSNVTVSVTQINDVDGNLSCPSSSSSMAQTPEATTPTKDIPRGDGSPIMRGLKSVLNMFRSSQSPIPPADNADGLKQVLSPAEASISCAESSSVISEVLASTPIAAHKQKESSLSKRSSPLKESITFNEDLEKELLWKDETTILFSQEKIPIHKLFFQHTPSSKDNIKNETEKPNILNNFNSTVEYMDISYNDSFVKNKTITDLQTEVFNANESDAEFVDCETTFTNDKSDIAEQKHHDTDCEPISIVSTEDLASTQKGVPDERSEKENSVLPQPSTTETVISITADFIHDAPNCEEVEDNLLTNANVTENLENVEKNIESEDDNNRINNVTLAGNDGYLDSTYGYLNIIGSTQDVNNVGEEPQQENETIKEAHFNMTNESETASSRDLNLINSYIIDSLNKEISESDILKFNLGATTDIEGNLTSEHKNDSVLSSKASDTTATSEITVPVVIEKLTNTVLPSGYNIMVDDKVEDDTSTKEVQRLSFHMNDNSHTTVAATTFTKDTDFETMHVNNSNSKFNLEVENITDAPAPISFLDTNDLPANVPLPDENDIGGGILSTISVEERLSVESTFNNPGSTESENIDCVEDMPIKTLVEAQLVNENTAINYSIIESSPSSHSIANNNENKQSEKRDMNIITEGILKCKGMTKDEYEINEPLSKEMSMEISESIANVHLVTDVQQAPLVAEGMQLSLGSSLEKLVYEHIDVPPTPTEDVLQDAHDTCKNIIQKEVNIEPETSENEVVNIAKSSKMLETNQTELKPNEPQSDIITDNTAIALDNLQDIKSVSNKIEIQSDILNETAVILDIKTELSLLVNNSNSKFNLEVEKITDAPAPISFLDTNDLPANVPLPDENDIEGGNLSTISVEEKLSVESTFNNPESTKSENIDCVEDMAIKTLVEAKLLNENTALNYSIIESSPSSHSFANNNENKQSEIRDMNIITEGNLKCKGITKEEYEINEPLSKEMPMDISESIANVHLVTDVQQAPLVAEGMQLSLGSSLEKFVDEHIDVLLTPTEDVLQDAHDTCKNIIQRKINIEPETTNNKVVNFAKSSKMLKTYQTESEPNEPQADIIRDNTAIALGNLQDIKSVSNNIEIQSDILTETAVILDIKTEPSLLESNEYELKMEIATDVIPKNRLDVNETSFHIHSTSDDIHKEPLELNRTSHKKEAVNVAHEDTIIDINIENKIQEVVEINEEEIIMSKDHSPFVSTAAQNDPSHQQPLSLEEIEDPFKSKSKVLVTPPASPKIVLKGYNFNFDEIDDPFATKTKIRMSPTPEKLSKEIKKIENSTVPPQNDISNNRRKSQPERKKPAMPKKKINSTFSGSVKKPLAAKKHLSEEIKINFPVVGTENDNRETPECKAEVKLTTHKKAFDISINIDPDIEKSLEVKPLEIEEVPEETQSTVVRDVDLASKVPKEQKSIDDRDVDTASEVNVTEEIETMMESFSAAFIQSKATSSSEQSTYYSAGTTSGESNVNRNVFNIPEIDDMNFNPFTTKSKMRVSPPPSLDLEFSKKDKSSLNNLTNTSVGDKPVYLGNFNPLVNESKISVSTQPTLELENKIASPCENSLNAASAVGKTTEYGYFASNAHETLDDKECANVSNLTCSSKATDDKDITVREVHTEDEDTTEGPFLEADDDSDKISDFDGEDVDMMQFSELPPQTFEENQGTGEMFIDAEAFEFLLNQNQSNVVSDSGKESLFLKFDPLFAKRVSTGGVFTALNRVQKRQSTPKKMSAAVKIDDTFEKSVAGPSSLNITYGAETKLDTEESTADFNVTVSKPMMVVSPAVNPVITPRNKTTTPTSSNRRSITFTSPAIAVIDRLLSLSANNSLVSHDSTITHMSREQNEADLALTQLRELLAEKEISVYNLRSESKELKDRLSFLESQMKTLESESEQRLKKVNELNGKLTEKTKINKSMAAVVEEYERTIARLIDETEQDKKRHNEERIQLTKERDEQTAHLASMEVSFSDLHSKYVKSKQIILTCKANEDACKKSIKEFEENLTKMQSNYELLKQHATSKLNHANQELEKMNRAHEAEVLKLNAMIKRKDMHITSLEETLAQKTKANEELTAICDELINKVG